MKNALWVVANLFVYITTAHGFCSMYEICHKENEVAFNCCNEDDTKPQILNINDNGYQQAINDLQEQCPVLFKNTALSAETTPLCCTVEQALITLENLQKIEVYKRCPTCIKNLKKHVCLAACGDKQTEFTFNPNCSSTGGNVINKPYRYEVSVYLSNEYMNATYDSCENVALPSSGQLVLDTTCSNWGSKECTPARWFEYFGTNDLAPFPFHFVGIDASDPQGKIHEDVLPCEQEYPGSSSCSCMDCAAACPNGTNYNVTEGFEILDLNGYSFITAIVLFVVSALVVFIALLNHKRFPDYNPDEFLLKEREKKTTFLERFFKKLGETMAEYSVVVLFLSSWVVIILTYGALSLPVTTNPVQIWASETSPSRLQKDFFDKQFTPFYRIEQIFIKTVGLKPFIYESKRGPIEMGPAFNKTFLMEVFKLQKQIEQIGQDVGAGLEKICYKPVVNQFSAPMKIDFCTVQSLLGLFKNDIEYFDAIPDYLEVITRCLRSPYSLECLAPYGGPVEPGTAVAGATNDDFTDAIGATLTFLVANTLEEDELVLILEWEKKFVEFVENWDKTERPEMMDIAFSAERSIEDELLRLSQGEILTTVISYLVMFVYITIALGRLRSFSTICLDSKVTLGIGGILIVLCSVVCSLGVCGYAQITTTLLTIEVIPFLVLAVGVDNIFIIVQTHQRRERQKDLSLVQEVGLTMSKVGPSILLTSFSEMCCFGIGAISSMPAVKTFAIYSVIALAFDFVFQMTAFVGLLYLDDKRYEQHRLDLFCCIKQKKKFL